MTTTLSNYSLNIQVPKGVIPSLAAGADKRDAVLAFARFFEALALGLAPGQPGEAAVIINQGSADVQLADAFGTLALASAAVGNTALVNGVTFTAVAGAPAANQFDQSGADAADATSLALGINSSTTAAAAVARACNLAGTVALASVLAGDYVEIDGIRFTAFAGIPDRYDAFTQTGTNTADCTALVGKINAHPVLSKRVLAVDGGSGTLTLRQKSGTTPLPVAASSATFTVGAIAATATVLITSREPGLLGNAIRLSGTGNVTASGAVLTGGVGGDTQAGFSFP